MKNKDFRYDMYIIIAIILCLIFLIYFGDQKFKEIEISSQEELFIVHNNDNIDIHKELADKIADFRPGSYKMIEVYTKDFEELFRVQFLDSDEYINNKNLKDEKELIELLETHDEGHTTITHNEMEEDIYFRWVTDSNQNKCLVMIYTSRHAVDNIWLFKFVCYIILILVLMLFTRMKVRQHSEHIKYYQSLSEDVQHRLMHN